MEHPEETWSFERWKTWVHDHRDIYESTVILNADFVLRLVKQRDDAIDQATRIRKAWDEERERL